VYDRDLAYVHHRGFSDFAKAAAPVILKLLGDAGAASGSQIVDLGCGSGVLAGELSRSGYVVTGVDISPAMVTLAREQVPDAAFVVQSLHEFFGHETLECAAITAIGEAFTYATAGDREAALRALFAQCARALSPGGLLLFDLIEHVDGEAMNYRNWSAEGDDWMIAVDVAEDPVARTITRTMWIYRADGHQYRRSKEIHRAWTFTREEIANWLRAAGFDHVRFDGGWPLPTRRLAVVARRSG
jgi:SAM-dependent methyltransferase